MNLKKIYISKYNKYKYKRYKKYNAKYTIFVLTFIE